MVYSQAFDPAAPVYGAHYSQSNTGFRVADAFWLNSTQTIRAVEFWGTHWEAGAPVDDLFNVTFYRSNGSLPDTSTAVNVGTAQLVSRVDTGLDHYDSSGAHVYHYKVNLATPVTAITGDNWLSVQSLTTQTATRFAWQRSSAFGTYAQQQGSNPYVSHLGNTAFVLHDAMFGVNGGGWLNTSSVNHAWFSGNNWFTGNTPTASSDAVFDQTGTYAVAFTGNAAAKNVLQATGTVTYNLGGHTLQTASDIAVADTAGRTAVLNVNATTGQLHAGYDLHVGLRGNGTLIQDSGTVKAGHIVYVGTLNGAAGTYHMNDGTIETPSLYIGSDGSTGTMNINGGSVEVNGDTRVLNNASRLNLAGGTLKTTDLFANNTPSRFHWTGGTLHLDGGIADAGAIDVPTVGTLMGTSTILGHVINAGTLAPGNSPGTLTIDGDLISTGLIEIEINGTDPGSYDRLVINGDFDADGTIRFVIGYDAQLGDTFDVMDVYGSVTDNGFAAEFTGTPTAAGLSWDVSQWLTTGTITLVPEPGAGLVLVGMASLLCLARDSLSRRASKVIEDPSRE